MLKYLSIKVTIFLVSIFLIISTASAQYFKGGLMAGFTGSQMDGDNLDGYNKFGFTAGVFANRSFNDFWGIQMELKFIMKGAAKPVTNSDPSIYRLSLYYYELPILATLKTSNKIKVESGFAIGYLSKANAVYDSGDEDRTYEFSKTEISWLAGIYYLLNEKFSVNLKFSYSLRAVSHSPGNLTIWGTYGQYNNLLNLSLYYTIR